MDDQDIYIPSGDLGDASGTVDSVNGQTGTVVLDSDDISDTGASHKFVTSAEKTKLSNLSGTNTGDQTSVTGNAGTATALQTARNIDGVSFNGTADITVVAPATHAASSKATPVDADELPIVDSAASNVLKKLTWANLKATLKTYFDSLNTTLTNKTMSGASNTFSNIGNSSLTNSSLTIGSTTIALGGTAATLAGVTLTTPTIASFANANHDHSNSAGGGALASSAVDSAGATMNSDTTLAGNGYFLDEDDMASDSATKVASQQSIKAFVIASIAASGGGDVSSNTATSVDSEIALFSSTSGKLIKRATGSGIAKLASGVLSVVTAPSGTILGTTDTQTVTNKDLTSSTNTTSTLGLSNPHKFRARRTSAQNTGNSAFAKVNFNTEDFDTGSNYDAATNFRFTAPVNGFYKFSWHISVSGGTTILIASLFKNGTEYSRGSDIRAPSNNLGSSGSDLIELVATDYVEVHSFGSGAVAIDTSNAYFSGGLDSLT